MKEKLLCTNDIHTSLYLELCPNPVGLSYGLYSDHISLSRQCHIYLSLHFFFFACQMGIRISILEDCESWKSINAEVPEIVSHTCSGAL